MIPKGYSRDFLGVGLIKVLWKTVNRLLNYQFTAEIKFHDVLHNFWLVLGAGTTTPEAKLLQQLMVMKEAVL